MNLFILRTGYPVSDAAVTIHQPSCRWNGSLTHKALEAWERMTTGGLRIEGDLTTPDPHHYTPRLQVNWCASEYCGDCFHNQEVRTRGCVVELTPYHVAH